MELRKEAKIGFPSKNKNENLEIIKVEIFTTPMLKNIFSQSFLAENNKSIDELITLGDKSDPMILPNLKLSFDPQFSTSLNVLFIEEQRKLEEA